MRRKDGLRTANVVAAPGAGRPEPPELSQGKAFHRSVQGSWEQRSQGLSVDPETPANLRRDWTAEREGTPASPTTGRGARGRMDIHVLIERDESGHEYVAVLEIKNTDFDRMDAKAVRRNIARHRRQLVDYIGSQLDLSRPGEFGESEAFVAPGMIYRRRPRDSDVRRMIEVFFDEECISVVWEDVPFVEEPPLRDETSRIAHAARSA